MPIRSSQMTQMQRGAESDLHAELAAFLRKNSEAARRVSDETLHRAIGFGIERSKGYGFESRASLGGFILLMFEVSPYFDAHPGIQRVLLDQNIPVESRVEALGLLVSARDWEEAGRRA